MSKSGIVLHRALATRAFTALWMLEELGVAYDSQMVTRTPDGQRPADYLALNPTGMVPTVVDDGVIIRETAAICIYLADRYGYGVFAPRIEDPERGLYLSWIAYSAAQLEPAVATRGVDIPQVRGNWGAGWRSLAEVIETLSQVLETSDFLVGDQFSAADVLVGSAITMRLHTGEMPANPILQAYCQRLEARPAAQRAGAMNWPPQQFSG